MFGGMDVKPDEDEQEPAMVHIQPIINKIAYNIIICIFVFIYNTIMQQTERRTTG